MGIEKYERRSEYSLKQVSLETKRAEAAQNIAKLLGGDGQLRVTVSREGKPRVRAHIPDEDGYMGYLEPSSYVGLAHAEGASGEEYVAERYFPHAYASGRPAYFWRFKPSNGELAVRIMQAASDTPELDFYTEADEAQYGYFLRLTQDLLHASTIFDYEHQRHQEGYRFQLPELQ